jgi:Secretion system C-terminal sorting domain
MKRNLLTLLIILLSVFTLWGQDWLSVDENNGFGNTFERVIYEDGAVYALSRRWRMDTVPGITVIKYDTLGHFLDSLEIFDKFITYTTFNGLIGFQAFQESIYIYGTVYGTSQTYLIKSNKTLDYYDVRYYTSQQADNPPFYATNILVNEQGCYLLGTELVKGPFQTKTYDTHIIHTDHYGAVKWRKTIGSSTADERGKCIVVKGLNELVIGGTRSKPVAGIFFQHWWHEWIISIDTSGNLLNQWESADTVNRSMIDMHLVGNRLVGVSAELQVISSASFNAKPYLFAFDTIGQQLLWRSDIPNVPVTPYTVLNFSAITPDSFSIIAVGRAKESGPILQVKADIATGTLQYARTDSLCIPGSDFVYISAAQGVAVLPSGSAIICGYEQGQTDLGIQDRGFLLKTNAWGEDLLDDCVLVSDDEPQYTKNELFIYPNPASDHITLQAPEQRGAYRVRMYASTGTLVREQLYAQGDVPEMQVRELSAGLYFVQLLSETGQLLGVGKVVVQE